MVVTLRIHSGTFAAPEQLLSNDRIQVLLNDVASVAWADVQERTALCPWLDGVPTFDGNRTSCGSDKGVVRAQFTSCGTIHEASSKSEARGQNGARGIQRSGNKKGERKRHSTFKSQTPNHQKYLMVLDNQKMEPPNSMVPKVAETTPPVVLTPPRLSQGGGGSVLDDLRCWELSQCIVTDTAPEVPPQIVQHSAGCSTRCHRAPPHLRPRVSCRSLDRPELLITLTGPPCPYSAFPGPRTRGVFLHSTRTAPNGK